MDINLLNAVGDHFLGLDKSAGQTFRDQFDIKSKKVGNVLYSQNEVKNKNFNADDRYKHWDFSGIGTDIVGGAAFGATKGMYVGAAGGAVLGGVGAVPGAAAGAFFGGLKGAAGGAAFGVARSSPWGRRGTDWLQDSVHDWTGGFFGDKAKSDHLQAEEARYEEASKALNERAAASSNMYMQNQARIKKMKNA